MKKNLFIALLLSSLCLMTPACSKNNGEPTPEPGPVEPEVTISVNQAKCTFTLDIFSSMFVTIPLAETINEKNVVGLSFEATSDDTTGITLSTVQESGEMYAFSTSKTGSFTISVKAFINNIEKLSYKVTVNVVDNSPAPEKIKDIPTQNIQAPVFENGGTNYDLVLDLAEYIDASDYVTYRMECEDSTVSMSVDGKVATFNFTSFGSKEISIISVLKGKDALTLTFTANLTSSISNQLFNGNFEQDWSGWDADAWDKKAYSIYDSEVDIWGNNVNASHKYLYGYYDETGIAEFNSSLFTISGSGWITFKMAGNCTEDLQLKLMKKVDDENTPDIEIAKFNNWYYGKYGESGFIMREYAYQVESSNIGSTAYFTVIDNRTADFGFVCLDDIVTYYSTAPANIDNYYEAGFKEDPSGIELDYSDTSNKPFTALENVTYQLPNGNFESGYDHWFMTLADKQAYAIYGSKVDIWGNPVNATKNYLYGYQKEDYTGEFHSDLFKVGGTGLITFKLAGYHTSDLQFRLMKYIADGDDVEIAKFNNWYCNPDVRSWSGFIMQNYWYYIDMATYANSYCYFVVYDMRKSTFGFICLDDIITYYEAGHEPTLVEEQNYYKAGYINDPREA